MKLNLFRVFTKTMMVTIMSTDEDTILVQSAAQPTDDFWKTINNKQLNLDKNGLFYLNQ